MQISAVTDNQLNAVSAARTQPKDFSENLQKAMEAHQTSSAALPSAIGSAGYSSLLELPSSATYWSQQRAAESEKGAEAKEQAARADEAAGALAAKSREVEPDRIINEGATATDDSQDAPLGDEEENPSQGNTPLEEVSAEAPSAEEEAAPIEEQPAAAEEAAPAEETPVPAQTTAPVEEKTSSEENTTEEVPNPVIGDIALTVDPVITPTTTESSMDYEELKQLLLLFCMMMVNGSSSDETGEMQMMLMVALTNYIGDLSALRNDVVSTASAQGIDEWALDQMDRSLFNIEQSYPDRRSRACTPVLTSDESNRSATLYAQVIKQFDVENRERYQNTSSSTWCNIFLWDVTSAMGAEIPHYIDRATGDIRVYPDVSGASELNANATFNWLNNHGERYGWKEVDAETAQAYANSGRPAITAWKNPSGGSGHVQVVSPSRDGTYNAEKGVTIAQAGRKLIEYGYASDVYGTNGMKKISYFVHA